MPYLHEHAYPEPHQIGRSNQPDGVGDDRHALDDVTHAERNQGRLKESGQGDAHRTPRARSDSARQRMRNDERQIWTGDDCQSEHCE